MTIDTPLTLIHVVASGEWGGPERYAFDVCRYFHGLGWNVKVLTRDTRAVDTHFRNAGIEVRHAPLRKYPDYYSARALARLFVEMPEGRGVVHVHRYNDALTCIIARKIAKRPDIRLVATRHKAERGRDSYLRRIIYRGIDSHLFVSEFSKQMFYSGWKPGRSPLNPAKTDVTYNSLYPSEPMLTPSPAQGPVSAAYRGKLKPGKGLETLIDAFALLKDVKVRLRILGSGHPDYVDRLRRRAALAGVGDRIDWIRNPDFPLLEFSKVHFGVLPSEEPEAFGMANLEFMAFGKPQISTLNGAQKELLSVGDDSIEVAPGDAGALADAIRLLASDPELRISMGTKAFERFNAFFSWPIFLSRLLPHYSVEAPSD